jgi:uncharacterized membrane protein YkvA (DUF1232 family)
MAARRGAPDRPSGRSVVPGPPRGRRRHVAGTLVERLELRQAAERSASARRQAMRMLRLTGDVILLLKDLATDPRVPRPQRVTASLAVAYLASPIDLVPDWLPGLGLLDDLVVVTWAGRRLLGAAGYDVIYELWRGSDEGLATVLALTGVQE